jgi:cell wall-associated NlpC family hydrolase
MRLLWKVTIAVALAVAGLCSAFAQDDEDATPPDTALQSVAERAQSDPNRWLTPDDRLSLLAAALDARVWRETEADCSHLVHAIYQDAGFPYVYAPSSDLYAGIENFKRVSSPRAGDLVVWRGHVGMVIKPSQHIFFSYLSSGPGTDDYETAYWKHRGRPRFYRYVKKEFAP